MANEIEKKEKPKRQRTNGSKHLEKYNIAKYQADMEQFKSVSCVGGITNIISGRPVKFQDPEELRTQIDGYFEEYAKQERPFTFSGLANWLEVDRQVIWNYSNDEKLANGIFFDIIKGARQRIEQRGEENLENSKVPPANTIFALKARHGWIDKQQTDVNLTGNLALGMLLKQVEDTPDE